MIRFFLSLSLALLIAAPVVSTQARAAENVQELTSPGGIKAWLVEERSIPFTALELRFKGGASLDAPGKRGAINLMTALIEEGAGELDARGFAEARETLAASYSFRAYDDALTISVQFLSENRDEAMALLRAALMDPRFDQDAVDRVREQVLSGLRSDQTDPDTIASRRFSQLAWGDHPYGSASDGTIASVAALSRDDMFDARARTLALDRLYVGAVGDISAEELGLLLDDLLGDLPKTGAAPVPEASVLLTGGQTVIPFDTPQSVAIFGQPGIAFDDPDFMPAYVLNQIFGEGGEARLSQEVREKRGLTYGIGSYLYPKQKGALVLGQVASANGVMAETVEVVRAEWAKIASGDITREELEAAQTYLTGAYGLRFDGNAKIAGILVGMQMQGQPLDYITRRNGLINAVTLEEINRVARDLYDPDLLEFVIVGQPAGLLPAD